MTLDFASSPHQPVPISLTSPSKLPSVRAPGADATEAMFSAATLQCLLVDELAHALSSLADELVAEASCGGPLKPGLTMAATVLRDRSAEMLAATKHRPSSEFNLDAHVGMAHE